MHRRSPTASPTTTRLRPAETGKLTRPQGRGRPRVEAPMQNGTIVRGATLLFAVGSLVFLVAHASLGAGCASAPAQRTAQGKMPLGAQNAQAGPGSYEGAKKDDPVASEEA